MIKQLTFRKSVLVLLIGILWIPLLEAQTTHVITADNNTFDFLPSFMKVQAGDTVDWQIDGVHNVVEVSKSSFNNNIATSNGGFSTPFGGGKVAFPSPGIYYYVCQPHVSLEMKGIIFVTSADAETFTASLSGHQQAVPVISLGKGRVEATLDGNTLVLDGSFSRLKSDFNPNVAGGAHIHQAIAGKNGGIQLRLITALNPNARGGRFLPDSNIFTLTTVQMEALHRREMYINIHTLQNGSGEIRGQLLPDGAHYSSQLYGSNQRFPLVSEGGGLILLDLVGDTLTVSGSFSKLNGNFNAAVAGGAHLHSGLAGSNGGINIRLKTTLDGDQRGGVFEADSNRFILNAAQKMQLSQRALYANIHTLTSPGGELRGQVLGMPEIVFRAFLSGANHRNPVVTDGIGMLMLELKDDQLTVSGSFSGLESNFNAAIAGGAHIHAAPGGRNGGISQGLVSSLNANMRSGSFEAGSNSFTLDSTQLAQLLARSLYVNIHSAKHPSGEIRGQILPEANYYFQAFLSGSQAAPPVFSRGGGQVYAEVRGSALVLSGSFNNLRGDFNPNVAGGSHLHAAFAGSTGPIQIRLRAGLDAGNRGGLFEADSNTYSLRAGMKDTLKSRLLYANIHTLAVGSGELRGQLLAEASNYFFAPISGSSQSNPLDREGTGALAAEWLGTRLSLSGSFRRLQSDFNPNVAGGAHLHAGLAGSNGPIVFRLNSDLNPNLRAGVFQADSNSFVLSSGLTDTLRKRMLYANIHTVNNGAGEIRGNLLPAAQAYFTTYASGKNQTNPNPSGGHGALKLELSGEQLTVTGSFADLQGDFNPNVAGGSHLHGASAGQNGGIEVGLKALPDAGLKRGIFEADSNVFVLTENQITALTAGDLYFNLHTTTYAPGEIRGQVLSESNFYPDSLPRITSPASGAELVVEGLGSTSFEANWSASTDPDGNLLVYIWQLATDSDFSSLILQQNTGTATSFSTDYTGLDSLLAQNGVNPGDTITLYHRAIASDGSLCLEGSTDSVSIVRGDVWATAVEEPFFRELSVYPNPFDRVIYMEFTSMQVDRMLWQLLDLSGKQISSGSAPVVAGKNQLQLPAQDISQGMYILRLHLRDNSSRFVKLIKE